MARRKSSSKKEVSLFPFLDILGCLIGALILIITTVVLEQMDTKPVAEAARIDDTRQEAARAQARLAAIEKQLALVERKADAGDVRLAAARRRAEEAARRAAEARQKLAAAEQITIDAPPVPKPADLAALAERKRKLDDDVTKVRAEIAERKKPVEQSIVVLPPGTGGGPKRGIFVEAAKGRVVVHDPKKPWSAAADKALADPRFKELLSRAAADKDAVITVLVRPDGLHTLGLVQKAAADAGARVGRVPLPGQGTLDLSGAR